MRDYEKELEESEDLREDIQIKKSLKPIKLLKMQKKETEKKRKKIVIQIKKEKKIKEKEKLKKNTWEYHIQNTYKCKCYQCPGIYANELIKFVGFRGFIDKTGVCHLDIKGVKYEGETFPQPIVPVTKNNRENLLRLTGKKTLSKTYYLGILRYEVEIMTFMFLLRNMVAHFFQ